MNINSTQEIMYIYIYDIYIYIIYVCICVCVCVCVCVIMKNVPCRLSSQWLCGNSCTWTHNVRCPHHVRAHSFQD